jgi:hypothetical protein
MSLMESYTDSYAAVTRGGQVEKALRFAERRIEEGQADLEKAKAAAAASGAQAGDGTEFETLASVAQYYAMRSADTSLIEEERSQAAQLARVDWYGLYQTTLAAKQSCLEMRNLPNQQADAKGRLQVHD